jgi:TolB protein
LLFVILLAWVVSAFSQPITLRTEASSVGRLEVVVMPFRAAQDSAFAGELPKSLRDLVNGDLSYSGYFNVIRPEDLPPDTQMQVKRVGWTLDTLVTFTGSTAARVHGSVTATWSGVTASIAIFRPPIREAIQSRDFSFNSENLRETSHHIAAWITKMLIGEDGAFTSKIVFVVKAGSNKDLWIMDWDGANPRSLTQEQTLNLSPTWAPDGNALYFTSFRRGNADIYRFDLGSGRISPLVTSPMLDSAPSVSPDGEWVAYTSSEDGNSEIYRIRPDGTGRTQLTFSYGIDTSPSWSPTSRDLLFTSDRGGGPQVYRMDLDGADVRRMTFSSNYNETGRWSRADLIAYASREIGFQIFTIAPDGSRDRRITTDGSNLDPSWSPDGMKLVYASAHNNKSSIWVCNWDGSDARQLSFGLEASQPQWSPLMRTEESGN